MGEIAIDVRGLSKTYVLRHQRVDTLKLYLFGLLNLRYREQRQRLEALRDVSLTVYEGETMGLVGPNGSGKSTLLRLMSGTLFPTQGEIRLKGSVASLIELGVGFHPDLTGRENVYLNASVHGLSRRETNRVFDAIWDFSELHEFVDVPLKAYSTGMYFRLAFAVGVHLDADILLLDEVLAVGDERFQRKCLDRMRVLNMSGKTVVFVTHNLEAMTVLCDRACLLWGGRVLAEGSPEDIATRYRELQRAQPSVMPTAI
ncbi:MAG: ABC transporter ATP-binding protein [candidate division NC10 bacterium]|nr:ABC transporter ATP-binding protein [candidate division NC10 bacterium]MDE2484677.1 ABC transporter ATP-binding protein [candidate division NC10 bacterium]